MNSSVKSFVPIVTAGLPLPGRAGAAADVLAPDDDELLVELLLLLPHAATAKAIAAASSDHAMRRLMVPRIACSSSSLLTYLRRPARAGRPAPPRGAAPSGSAGAARPPGC